MYRGPRGAPRSAPSREQQLRTARSLDESSTAMIQFAVNKAKKHPMLVSSYTIGLLLCLFFTGVALSVEQERQFEADLQSIDYHDLNAKQRLFDKSYQEYYSSKGWFSCDARCQHNKNAMESRRHDLEVVKRNTDQQLSDAKAKLGILSSVGVEETRDLFWTRFSQGKRFAQNQSKWDALFVGMRSLGRDESIVSYLLELLLRMLFNFTLGMIGTVIGFIASLYSLLSTYQASLSTALVFFSAASLAALSFAMTWIFLLYGAAAGTVYVGAKAIASNMRLQDGGGRVEHEGSPGFGRRDYRD